MNRRQLLDLAMLIFLLCCGLWLLLTSPGGVR